MIGTGCNFRATTGLLGLFLSSAAYGQFTEETFICRADNPGAPESHVQVTQAGLMVRVGDGKLKNYGPVDVASNAYTSYIVEPVGNGQATIIWTIDRPVGGFSLMMDVRGPGDPMHVLYKGRCRQVGVPQSSSSTDAPSGASSGAITVSQETAAPEEQEQAVSSAPERPKAEVYQPPQDQRVCEMVDRSKKSFHWNKEREAAVRSVQVEAQQTCHASGGDFSIAGLSCTTGEGVWKCSAMINCLRKEEVCTTPGNGGASRQ